MNSRLRDRARELRRLAPDAERALWAVLRMRQRLGVLFHRQQPIGRFIVDFVCWERRLVIEVDLIPRVARLHAKVSFDLYGEGEE